MMMTHTEGDMVLYTSAAVQELYVQNLESGGDEVTPEEALAQALLLCGADAGEYSLAGADDQVLMGVVFPQTWEG